jgi:hypothetical protein
MAIERVCAWEMLPRVYHALRTTERRIVLQEVFVDRVTIRSLGMTKKDL